MSVQSYLVKNAVATWKLYQRLEIWVPVAPSGMIGAAPGLTGTTKAVPESVEYTAG